MVQLNPYLRFNGNCREAMTFYQSSLGGELTIQTVGESPIEPIFAKLSAGANVLHPLTEEYFGTFGDLVDKFGIGWMFQAGGNANA